MSERITLKSTNARIDALEASLSRIETLLVASLDPKAPAKTRKPAKKAPKPAAKAPTKGSQTRETLSRKAWNRTLTAKAKLAGGDTYKRVLGAWDEVSEQRDAGFTPDEVLAQFA